MATPSETEQQELDELVLTVRENPDVWWEAYGKIRDINGKSVSPTANVLQQRIFALYGSKLRASKLCRAIGLKPRKRGFSTAVSALAYSQVCNFSHEAVIVGDKLDTSETVMAMMRHYQANDEFANDLKHWSSACEALTQVMRWQHGAMVHQRTAGGKNTARGMTPHFIHGTETAHWEHDAEAMLAVMNAIPDEGFNCVFLESTPNGAGGEFFNIWNRARWPRPDECPEGQADYWRKWEAICPNPPPSGVPEDYDFVRIFAAWFEFAESRIALDEAGRSQIRATLDRESWYEGERKLIEQYKVDEEQLAWRRMVIKTKCSSDPNQFDQEYPRDPTSCFLASGMPVFNADGLARLEIMSASCTPRRGNLSLNGDDVIFTPDPDGWFEIWEDPAEGRQYLIPCDPASLEQETVTADPDASSAGVIRAGFVNVGEGGQINVNPALVARIRAPCRDIPETWGLKLDLASRFYGRCIVVPEANNKGGGATIEQLRKRGVPFYKHQLINPTTGHVTLKEGWHTNDHTRRDIIGIAQSAVLYGGFDIFCQHAVAQFKTFVRKPTGREEHASGCHDDDVLMLAIGLKCLPSATTYSRIRKIDRRLLEMRRREDMAGASGLGGTF